MNNIISTNRVLRVLLLALLVTGMGCSEDYLERTSLTAISENNFWRNASDAQLGINGVYAQLQSNALYGGSLNQALGMPMYDVIGDNAYNQYKWEGGGRFMEGTLDPTHFLFSNLWNTSYSGISRANIAIEQISQMNEEQISAEEKANYLGQAHFLRALFYFNIAVYYEDAPLITEYQSLEEAYVPKNTYAEITTKVVEDLEFAIENLPEQQATSLFGYATKGAAIGLLARVQLYNQIYDGPNGVLTLTEQLLQLGYSLHPDYGELFSTAGEYSNEIVFSIRFLRGAESNNGETFSATFAGTPKVDSRPMPNLVDEYYCTDGLPITESPLFDPNNEGANRDPRTKATIYFPGDLFLTEPEKEYNGSGPTGYGHRKYIRRGPDAEGNAVFAQGSQDFYLIRYADVLLMRAEALVETGSVAEAAELVNQVRARVNMPAVEEVEGMGLSQAEMREVVRHERRVELALEGLRFMDLKRWGEMEAAFMRATNDNIGPYNPVYQGEKSQVFAIPQSELDVNANLTQNPVW
jgi:starch-binding outer membrane protein, SusD/RagB family